MFSFLRNTYAVFIFVLFIIITGCSKSSKISDTYLQFSVEGKEYKLDHIVLDILKLNSDNWHFIGLGQDPMKTNIVTAVPTAGIQWRMRLGNVKELQGRKIDLSDMNDDKLLATAIFTLTQDIGVTPDINSEIKLEITAVSENYVEGTFAGKNLTYVSMSQDIYKKVDVSGSFRAKINISN